MQRSIILVTVDCLRADHVGFMGYRRPTTPFLDSVANEGFVVSAAIVAGAPTYYSFPAILGSRYPLSLGRDVVGFAPEEPTIASVLRESGYATGAFSAGNPYVSARFGYERGFDQFEDFLTVEPNETFDVDEAAAGSKGLAGRLNRRLQSARDFMGPLRLVYDELYFRYCQRVTSAGKSMEELRRFPSADVIVDRAVSWLQSNSGRPFFLWLHLMDPHAPYYPEEEALRLMGDRSLKPFQARYLNSYWNRSDLGPWRLGRRREEILALYDAGIRWVDEQLSRLVQWLKQTSRWDECIFAVTADHGEEFLDHAGRYHPPTDLNEELIRVPLLLRVPREQKTELSRTPISLLDLAPTLMDAAGIKAPSEFQGKSRLDSWRHGSESDEVAITESVCCTNPFRVEGRMRPRVLSVREKRFKLILHFDPWKELLYDLEADPGERAPVAPTAQKLVRRRLLEIARDHVRLSIERRNERARAHVRIRELRLEWMRSKAQAVMAQPF